MNISKSKLRRKVNQYINKRYRNHYLKWNIDGEWSIRYFFTFDSRKQYEGKWVLKSHCRKIYIILTISEALDFIKHKAKHIDPIEVWGLKEDLGFRRMIIGRAFESYIDKKDRVIE